MVVMKTKINIQLDVLDITKQLGTRISAKEMKTPCPTRPSTDVLARCGVCTYHIHVTDNDKKRSQVGRFRNHRHDGNTVISGTTNTDIRLKNKARAWRVTHTNGTYFDPTGTPFWVASTLSPRHIGLAMQYRCMRAQAQIRVITHCVRCNTKNRGQPTVKHYLSHCAPGAEIARDPARKLGLTAWERSSWKALDDQGVSDLCAQPQNRENLLTLVLDTLDHCQLFDMP
jgi:hypothetical protein